MGVRRRWGKAWKAVTANPADPAGYAALAAAEAAMSRSYAGNRPLSESPDAATWHADAAWTWMGVHLAVAGRRQALLEHLSSRPQWTAPGAALVDIATGGLTSDRTYALYYALLSAGTVCEAVDPVADLADTLAT